MKIKEDVASVYIIQNLDLPKRIKIGYSKDVDRRLKDIRNQSGCEMSLIYKSKPVYDYAPVESSMHKMFDEHRGIGEWFHMNSKHAVSRLKDMTSSSEVCKIVKHYENGKNATAIAKALNVSRSGVVKYLKSKGYMLGNPTKFKSRKSRVKKVEPKKALSKDRIEEMVEATNNKLGKRTTCRS